MGNENSAGADRSTPAKGSEPILATPDLKEMLRRSAESTSEAEEAGDPDTSIRLNDEGDTLYEDGLEVDEEPDTLAGTRGTTPGIAKP
jgi:hypothetical protein